MPFKPTVTDAELDFRDLIESGNVGVLVHVDNVLVYANHALANMFGYESVDALLKLHSGVNLYCEEERERLLGLNQKRTAGLIADIPYDVRAKRSDGSTVWVEQVARRVAWGDGWCTQVMVHDVSQRRATETALRNSEYRFRAVTENAPCAITVKDVSGRLTLINPLACEWYAAPESELLGRRVHDLASPDTADQLSAVDREVIANATTKQFERRMQFEAGRVRWVQTSKSPIVERDGTVSGVLTIGTDVTAQKEMETALRQSQKMEALGQMTGGIAHDFNNILASILGFSELAQLNQKVAADESLRDSLTEITKAANRARDLVSKMLTFARPNESEDSTANVPDVVNEVLALLRATLPATVTLRGAVNDDGGEVSIESGQLHQLVMNLCLNARDAVQGRGQLEVRVSRTTQHNSRCDSCSSDFSGRFVEISVSDNGDGIPEDISDRIFDPFFSTKRPGQGSGLGLSVVHGIVHGHAGHIAVRTSADRGTVFSVFLPELITETEEVKPDAVNSPVRYPTTTQHGRILVIDDEVPIARLLCELLEIAGHRTVMCTDSTDALDRVKADPAGFDVVVSDQTMPQLTGLELAAALTSISPDLPMVLCSGFHDTSGDLANTPDNVRARLNKPIDHQDLARLIEELLNERAPPTALRSIGSH
ncbi:MAG: PAS domain S-box protein [Pseudomonadota bacterium]